MAKQLRNQLISFGLIIVLSASSVWGQENAERVELSGTRKQLATIVFAGLAGAILGLSTLSFYGRPQENLSNIAFGFAFGIIGGTIFTTYKAATQPFDAYDLSNQITNPYMLPVHEQGPRLALNWNF